MKRVWRTLFWGLTATGLISIGLLVYATYMGRLAWFQSVQNVVLTEDGRALIGSLHRSGDRQAYVLTRRLSHRSESYWISLPGVRLGRVSGCGDWSAPDLPLFFISKLQPPCFLPLEEGPESNPSAGDTDRQLVLGHSMLTFFADDGKRIQAYWQ